jgi:cob(I)alamin adenosyltransferase
MTDDPASLRRPGIADSQVATGKGDDGTTGLLYGGRVSKADPRTEAYGTVDEAVAAIGVARAEVPGALEAGAALPQGFGALLLRLQRELVVVAAELATNPERADAGRPGVTQVTDAMLTGLETLLRDAEAAITIGNEFVMPGADRLSAALEVARGTVRRAERRTVTLLGEGAARSLVVAYLNRLADLLWVLARQVEAASGSGTSHVPRSLAGANPRENGEPA